MIAPIKPKSAPKCKESCQHREAGDLGSLADDRRLQDVVPDQLEDVDDSSGDKDTGPGDHADPRSHSEDTRNKEAQ